MAKLRTVFNCTECGAPHYKWGGKCDSCGSWNSLVEEIEEPNSDTTLAAGMALIPPGVPQLIGELDPSVGKPQPTGIGELDRVLDGGLVPGSVTLLGGEPGIGKSTLLLQLLAAWPQRTLYVTAEESAQQVRLRAERLNAIKDDLWLLSEMSMTNIFKAIDKVKPQLLIIDSIQAVADPQLGSAPGSVVQVRGCAHRFVPTLEGQRPLLVEVQALTNPTGNNVPPRRSAQGLDPGRLAMLLAVLERRARISLAQHEVYASVVGGVKLGEPGGDLGLCMALVSAVTNKPIPADLVVCGEVGLGGEIRQVGQMSRRLAEAARLGFTRAIVPASSESTHKGLRVQLAGTLSEALALAQLSAP